MPDDPNTPQPPTTQAAPAPQSTAPTLTPEIQAMIEVERNKAAAEAARKAHDSAWAEARRKYEKPAEPPKNGTPSEPAPSMPGLTEADVARMVARESDFVRSVTAAKLPSGAEQMLRTLLSVEKPENVAEWVNERARAFGVTPTPQPNTSAQAAPSSATPSQAAAQPPSSSAPPPATPAPQGTIAPTAPSSNVLGWSRDMRDAYLRSKATYPHDLYHRANHSAWREAARMALDAMATVQVVDPETNRRR